MTTKFLVRSLGEKHFLSFKTVLYDGVEIRSINEGGIKVFEVSDPEAIVELVVRRRSHAAAVVAAAKPNRGEATSEPKAHVSPPKKSKAADQVQGKIIHKDKEVGACERKETAQKCVNAPSPSKATNTIRPEESCNSVPSPALNKNKATNTIKELESKVSVSSKKLKAADQTQAKVIHKCKEVGACEPKEAAQKCVNAASPNKAANTHPKESCNSVPPPALDTATNTITKIEAKWYSRYNELVQYKRQHGNCHVPKKTHHLLHFWVRRQRERVRKGFITDEQFAKLEEIGVIMGDRWQFRFNQLVEYKRKNGNCNVPDVVDREHEYFKLSNWVQYQRLDFKRGTMSEKHFAKLNDIGFQWNQQVSLWHFRYSELMIYKKENGDCRVRFSYPPNPQLGLWVFNQRKQFKAGKLSVDRIAKLNEIGFIWVARET